MNIIEIEDRPKCGYCKFGLADGMGKRKDGSRKWRTWDGKFECKPCQVSRINTTSEKGYPTMNYQHHKINYCENKDGRLGFVCPSDMLYNFKLFGNFSFLDADHIDENKKNNDGENFQTLCHAPCHLFKSQLSVATQYTEEAGLKMIFMLNMIYDKQKDKNNFYHSEVVFKRLKERMLVKSGRLDETDTLYQGPSAHLSNFM